MATQNFQLPSPYSVTPPPPPKEDEAYYRHLEDLKLDGGECGKVYGVALFGLGRAGTIHLSNLTKNRRVKVFYIVDEDKKKLEKAGKYYKIEDAQWLTFKDSHMIYKDPKVNYVIVSSPTFTHEEIIETSLRNGKAIFCEKPVAGDIEKTKKLFSLADKVGLPLLCAFNRRFDPSYAHLHERVRNGEVGKVLTVKVCSRNSPVPTLPYLEISGGIFHDCAVHDINQILSIVGELPNKVICLANANISEIRALNDFDSVAISMSFPSGAVGIVDLSRQCSYGYDQRLEVFGEKGMLKVENRAPLQIEQYTNESVKKCPNFYSFATRYGEAYQREMDHFVRVLDGVEPLSVTAKYTLAVSKVATAVEESVYTGRVVELTWTDEERLE